MRFKLTPVALAAALGYVSWQSPSFADGGQGHSVEAGPGDDADAGHDAQGGDSGERHGAEAGPGHSEGIDAGLQGQGQEAGPVQSQGGDAGPYVSDAGDCGGQGQGQGVNGACTDGSGLFGCTSAGSKDTGAGVSTCLVGIAAVLLVGKRRRS